MHHYQADPRPGRQERRSAAETSHTRDGLLHLKWGMLGSKELGLAVGGLREYRFSGPKRCGVLKAKAAQVRRREGVWLNSGGWGGTNGPFSGGLWSERGLKTGGGPHLPGRRFIQKECAGA